MSEAKTYVQRAPRIRAMRWDGTIEGAQAIVDFLAEETDRSFSYMITTTNMSNAGDPAVRLKFDGPGIGDWGHFHAGDWFIVEANGRFSFCASEVFERDYQPAD